MSNVLVVAEQLDGSLRKASLSAVTAGKQLAEKTGGKMHTLLLGSGVGAAATELASFGGEALHVADSPELAHALAEPYAQVIAQAAQEIGANVVIAAATTTGKDILPRVAAKLGAGMASDVLSFEVKDGTVTFRRPMWAGSVLADVTIETPKKVLTIRAAEFGHAEKASSPAPIQPLAVQIDATKVHTRFIELRQVKSTRPDLGDARIVVSGGRGTKGDFKPIEALADSLGAAIGASRAAADAGWVPSDYQVGQTGKTVAPDLYIAVGISGAIQHVAGMKNSKVIVAINKDPDAAIFQIADYGLVGDLFKILPELQAALAKH
jgi:electron transfer flavoprotein alpha subunit